MVTPAAGLDANNFVMGKLYCTSSAAETLTVAHRPLEAEGVSLSSSTIFTLPSNAGRGADSDNWCVQFWIARYQLRVFFRHKDGASNGWGPWKEVATATPPKEYDLPLAAGLTAFMRSKYFKSQNNIATFYATVRKESGFYNGALIATLPSGFRPSERIDFPATFSSAVDTGVRVPGFVMLNPDGRLSSAATGTGLTNAYVFGSFVAEA